MKIHKVIAREILDSRGYPTVEVEVMLSNNITERASVPSGASVGRFEAVELRDNDNKYYCGKGVTKAVRAVNTEIAAQIINMNALNQKDIDQALIKIDGTENKSRLGANAILAVSLAVAKSASKALNIPLYQYLGGSNARTIPTPLINIINGGLHADNNLNFQEFMIIPIGKDNFKNAIRKSAEVFHNLKIILNKKNYSINVGDEGGFAPNINSNEEVIEVIIAAVEKAGYKMSIDFALGLDVAASTFYKNKTYNFANVNLNYQELVEYYINMINTYPIISIEDPMAEDDYEGWQLITKTLKDKVQLIGDDLFVTNCQLIKNGIENNMANAVLIKPNQIGTLTETNEAIKLAQENNYNVILSHRSGETEDTTIAHIAVATNCGQIKSGSLSRSERLAKYNELIRIEEGLGVTALYKI